MFRTILVPLDGSALSERALPFAIALARAANTNGRIILLRAATGLEASQIPDMGSDAAAQLDEVADRVRKAGALAEPHVHYVYSQQEAAEAICRGARERQVDVIVMATHGRGGLGRWLYGSVADQVLRRAEEPVLLVPASGERTWPADRPLRMLVPLDGSPLSEQAIGPAAELAAQLRAEMLLLQVVDTTVYAAAEVAAYMVVDPEAEMARARLWLETIAGPLRASGRAVEVLADTGSPSMAIPAVARDRQVDLIAMATHGRGGVARLVLGSVATAALQHAGVPLLLVRPTASPREPSRPDGTSEVSGASSSDATLPAEA